jgi:hypothetical protein
MSQIIITSGDASVRNPALFFALAGASPRLLQPAGSLRILNHTRAASKGRRAHRMQVRSVTLLSAVPNFSCVFLCMGQSFANTAPYCIAALAVKEGVASQRDS